MTNEKERAEARREILETDAKVSPASEGINLLVTAGDTGLAAVIEGAASSVPVLGLLHGAFKAAREASEYLYQRKVSVMIAAVDAQTNTDERQKFASEQLSTAESRDRFGASIMLMLEKVDEFEKVPLLGRLAAAHVRGDLTTSEWRRVSSMVLRAYYTDLELLKSFQRGTGAPNQTLYNTLYSIGFLDKDGEDEGRWDAAGAADGGDVYALNRYGATLVRYGFGVSPGT